MLGPAAGGWRPAAGCWLDRGADADESIHASAGARMGHTTATLARRLTRRVWLVGREHTARRMAISSAPPASRANGWITHVLRCAAQRSPEPMPFVARRSMSIVQLERSIPCSAHRASVRACCVRLARQRPFRVGARSTTVSRAFPGLTLTPMAQPSAPGEYRDASSDCVMPLPLPCLADKLS
jgi:hypothetical protein